MIRVAAGIVLGAMIGALYAITPVTLWALALALLVLGLAAIGLPPGERRLLFVIGSAALVIRMIAIGAMMIGGIPEHNDLATGALRGDEAYNLSRALRTRDVLQGAPVGKYDHVVAHDEYGDSSYVTFLTWVQAVAGPTPYSMRLLNSVLFVAAALLLWRVARQAFGPAVALTGLAGLLAVPSLAAASVSLLKEPAYFLLSALLVAAVAVVFESQRSSARAIAAIVVVAAFIALDDLRRGALLLSGAGIVLAIVVRVALLRWWTAAAATAVAVGALTIALATPAIHQRVIGGLESAAKLHSGHVFTVGHAYKLLDEGFYVNPQATAASTLTLTTAQAARFALRGVASFVFEPLPWQMASLRELLFLPELLLWYGIVILVPVGVWAGWRMNPHLTSLLLCFPIPTAVALALTTGNVGTLLRLRGLVLPYLLWLSALGLFALIARSTRTNRA